MGYYRVINWQRYQHYKNRNPPWIKLHREIHVSQAWVSADDKTRVLMIASMLLAAANDNKIPSDPAYIKRVMYLNSNPDFQRLVDLQFLEYIESASKPLAHASKLHTNAMPETETEVEKERTKPVTPKRDRRTGTRIPEDFVPKEAHYDLAKSLGINCEMEFQSFRDYFLGVSGTRGVKLDWNATLRNWLRNSLRFGGGNGQASKKQQRTNSNQRLIMEEILGAEAGPSSESVELRTRAGGIKALAAGVGGVHGGGS